MLRGNWKAKDAGRAGSRTVSVSDAVQSKLAECFGPEFQGDCDYDIQKFVIVFGSPSGTQGGELVQESSSRL
jgi:hypothetical protein